MTIFSKHLSWKRVNLFTNIFTITLILLALPGSVMPTLADSSSLTPKELLKQEIKSLAQSDVEDDIPRRTEFIIKLYTDNQTGLKTPEIRKIYEEEYFHKLNEQFPKSLLKHPATPVMAGILGAFWVGGLLGLFFRGFSGLKTTKVTVNIPFGIGSLELSPNSTAKKAAWLLYIELSTRIATQQLRTDEGLLREALDSLYKIFEITRQILRDAGPDVGMTEESVGGIAIDVLNEGLRPFLAQWHPALEQWEAERPDNCSRKAHEEQWQLNQNMRQELEQLTQDLSEYVKALAKIARS